jgi:flagellin
MSSILTNNSAMVALDTLRGINKNLGSVQSEISTGKKIATSTDNAAIWSIATVMESDVKSFDQVSDSLNLGSATVGVAQSASEQVTGLLQEAKSLIVAANDPSVSDSDRTKYQTDIAELTKTVGSIVDAASFNGQNLLKGEGSIDVLSSLNRQDDGTVTAGKVNVERQNLSTNAASTAAPAVAGGVAAPGAPGALAASSATPADGADSIVTISGGAGAVTEGSTYSIEVGGTAFEYLATATDDINDVNAGLAALIDDDANFSASVTTPAADPASNDAIFTITNDSGGASTVDTPITTIAARAETFDVAAGGLADLATIDVSDLAGAASGLAAIDGLLQKAIDATAQFGSKQKRIDNQNEFISTLKDSLKTGIGAMTDANLEEASARLQSLQVQQQLGVQALSIANQGPQSLLSLFR